MSDTNLFDLVPSLRRLNEMELDELRAFERQMHDVIPEIQRAIRERQRLAEEAKRRLAESVPVDRAAVMLADGSPVTPEHRELKDNGQQRGYMVLTEAERAKGFVRPVRRTYRHSKCDTTTSMGQSIAETYARDPKFYNGTFCVQCGKHFPLVIDDEPQFFWIDDGSAVGS
jgi:hypothetical protein